jgi:nitroreductase/NAD-dependent dihydropyrimidine dehydrogenase PreA subunit
MNIIQVNQDSCIKCGTCAANCPRRLIDFSPKEFPKQGILAESICTKCGHCVIVCPTGSLIHREMPVETCSPLKEELKISAEQCEYLLRGRRSIRVFKNQPVPRDVIVRLIEIARYAPTGHNRQDVEWSIIDDKEKLDSLEEIGLDWMRWMIKNQPPQASTFDMEVMLKQAEIEKSRLLRGAPVLIITHAPTDSPMGAASCTIALTFLDLIAKSQGLGCCWGGMISLSVNAFPPMRDALPVPEGQKAFGYMMLGYPKFTYRKLPFRKPPVITWYSK